MNDVINIMHVRDSSGIFGAERVILTLARNIDHRLFNFTLLCLRRRDGRSEFLVSRAQQEGIRVVTVDVKGRFDIKAIKKIRAIFKEENIQIFHSHDFKSDFYGFLSSVNTGIKKVATAHGSTRDSLLKKAYLFFNENIIYPYFNSVIAVSEELQGKLKRAIPSGKIKVIQNGLDIRLIQNEIDENISQPTLAVPGGHLTFGVVGRLFPDKGHRFFLEAFANVHRRYPATTGLIVGGGPAREEIAHHVKQLGLEKSIILCGVRSDMKAVYERLDFLLIPSLTEGLPYVLLEAMASNIPVLATAVGDIPLLIKDGETGSLVPSADAKALESRMIDFIQYPEMAVKMAIKARELVEKKYSARTMAKKTEELYLSLFKK